MMDKEHDGKSEGLEPDSVSASHLLFFYEKKNKIEICNQTTKDHDC